MAESQTHREAMRALLAPTQQLSGEPSLNNPMVRFPTEEDIREWEEAKAERLDADGWLQSGGLLYRLTDERRPQNRDEINVTMANGSRDDAPRAARASEILALLTGARQPSGEVTDGRAYPDEMSPALRDVLGRPNFWCGPIAHEMRAAGTDIKTKAEDEQAHVLHWLVKLVLDHGDNWQKQAAAELRDIREKANAARAGEGHA
ncbi:hypothetical protein WJ73_19660 [Burkholderia ubonensis]|nr:hypothetical protein WJ73_19660 [Burkholderia ubonensis]